MAVYTIWMLSNNASGATTSAGSFTSNNGNSLAGKTVTFGAGGTYQAVQLNDEDTDLFFQSEADTTQQTLAQAVTINGTTYPIGTKVIAEYTLVLQDPATGNTYTVIAVDFETSGNTIEAFVFVGALPPTGVALNVINNFDGGSAPYSSIVICFAAGTLLATPDGERAVEALAPGDLVLTRDNGAQPVRWIGKRYVTAAEIAQARDVRLAPVRIRSGALGPGLPERDLVVSPQHRILVEGWRAELHFGEPEILVAACHLVDGQEITVEPPERGVTYFHVMFDRHEIVLADGLPAESFRAGPEAMKAISEAARAEILTLFPELADYPDGLVSARPMLSGAEAALVRL